MRLNSILLAIGLLVASAGLWLFLRSGNPESAATETSATASSPLLHDSGAPASTPPPETPASSTAVKANTSPHSPGKRARCVVRNRVEALEYAGPCNFIAEGNGSFTIEDAEAHPILGYAKLTVKVTTPGVGELTALRLSGATGAPESTSASAIQRSPEDTACWVNAIYSVCAY